jgi:hypothetical protein
LRSILYHSSAPPSPRKFEYSNTGANRSTGENKTERWIARSTVRARSTTDLRTGGQRVHPRDVCGVDRNEHGRVFAIAIDRRRRRRFRSSRRSRQRAVAGARFDPPTSRNTSAPEKLGSRAATAGSSRARCASTNSCEGARRRGRRGSARHAATPLFGAEASFANRVASAHTSLNAGDA